MMVSHSERLRKVRSLALLLTALSLLIVLVSAYIRLEGAGLGCADWPACYGQLLAGAPHPHTGVVRVLHRAAASLSLLLAFYAAWHCIRPVPIQPVARYATLLLALMIMLTFVGIWSADAHRVWTSFVNLLGGLGLVSLSWRMFLAADAAPFMPRPSRIGRWLPVGLAALLIAVAIGALIGARFAAIACPSVPSCGGIWWPPAQGWTALNPVAAVSAPSLPGAAGGVTLNLLHRYLGAAALLLLGMAGLQALKTGATRTAGAWLLAFLAIEFALGSLTVLSGFSLWLAIGHSVGAAALLAAGINLMKASE